MIDRLIKQKAEDSFPDVSRQTIYSVDLNNSKLVILNRTNFSPPGGTNSDITIFMQLKYGDETISKKPFYVERLNETKKRMKPILKNMVFLFLMLNMLLVIVIV